MYIISSHQHVLGYLCATRRAMWCSLLCLACSTEHLQPSSGTTDAVNNEPFHTLHEPLTTSPSGGEWGINGWSPVNGVLNNNTVTLAGTPVACEAPRSGGTAVFGRNDQNRFVASFSVRSPFTHWLEIGTQTFTSKPACADLDGVQMDVENESRQLAIFGKDPQNRYRVAVLRLHDSCELNVPPPSPSLVSGWTQLSSTTFASAPAATVFAGALWLAGRRSNNSLIMRRKWLDMTDIDDRLGDPAAWDGEYALPTLPSNYVPVGDPAMVHVPEDDGYMVLATFARLNNVTRLYYVLGNGISFSSWAQVTLPAGGPNGVTVASDLALEVGWRGRGSNDPVNGVPPPPPRVTAYFIGTKVENGVTESRIYQASANVAFSTPYTWETFTPLKFQGTADPLTTPDIQVTDHPAVAGGALGTDGHHRVIAKRSGGGTAQQLYTVQSAFGVE